MTRLRVSVAVAAAVFGTAAAFVGITAAPAGAKLTPAQKCAAAKEKATAKLIAAKIKCYKKTQLAPADPACLEKATAKFAKAFAKAEKPDACLDAGNAAAAIARVDTLVEELRQTVQPPTRTGRATPAQLTCATAKFDASGKYAAALLNCNAQSLSTSSAGLLTLCLQKGRDTLSSAFTKAEAPGGCYTINDAGTIQQKVDTHVTITLQMFLPPPGTPTPTPTLVPGAPTPTRTRTPTPDPRFVDNGDGTITDSQTGLMWEKKDDAGGIHDKDNNYTWCLDANGDGSCDNAGNPPDGPAFSVFLATLNAPPCFAGHCDWRLPTSAGCCGFPTGQAAEIESIIHSPCAGGPCVSAAFNTGCTPGCSVTGCSCTVPACYWTASTYPILSYDALDGEFSVPFVGPNPKPNNCLVRAVR